MKNYQKYFSCYLIFFTFLLTNNIIRSQNLFDVKIGGNQIDAALSCTINDNQTYTIGGHTNSFAIGSYDLYLLKLDESGSMIWNKTYGNSGMDGIREIQRTNDKGYILGGYSSDGAFWDFLVMKVDSLGNPSWAKSIGGYSADECLSVNQTKDSGFIAVGFTKSYSSEFADVYVIKYNKNGGIAWNKIIGWDYNDYAHFVIQTKDNGYAILGYSDLNLASGNFDIVISKLDSLGNLMWVNAYSLDGNEYALEFKETQDEGFIIAGYTKTKNIFLIKTTSDGTVRWAKKYIGATDCFANSISICSDRGFIISGYIGATNPDAILLRTDSEGNLIWARKYAGNGSESFGDAKESMDKGFFAVGTTSSVGDYSFNIFALKTDSLGQSICPSSLINLTSQLFTPTAYQFFYFHTLSAGVTYDWTYTTTNPSPNIITSCIVPVELIQFNHSINKNIVELKWSTATELNNHRFEIYRDDILIGFKQGFGTTSEHHDYIFSDEPPRSGKYTYRLMQIDYDGSTNEVGKLVVDFDKIPLKYMLEQNFPNPFNPTTKINFAVLKTDFVTLRIFDLLGKEITTLVNEEKEAGSYEVTFDGSGLSSGIYIYTISTGSFTKSKKLMLVK